MDGDEMSWDQFPLQDSSLPDSAVIPTDGSSTPPAPSPMAARFAAALQLMQQQNAQQVAATPAPTAADPRPIPPAAQSYLGQAATSAPVTVTPPQPQSDSVTRGLQQTIAAQPSSTQSGPVKSFLKSFLYGAGQGALQHVGLPTDYEKEQNATKLDIQQQAADTANAYKTLQGQQLQGQLAETQRKMQPFTIPDVDGIPQQLRGLQTTVGNFEALAPLFVKGQTAQAVQGEKNEGALDSAAAKSKAALDLETMRQNGGNPKDHVFKSIDGNIVMVSKRDGSVLKTLGGDTALLTPQVRARAQAQYASVPAMDDAGNPTAISRLQQLQTGTPTMNEKAVQTLSGDKLGVQTYLNANHLVRNNIGVLQDEGQRAIIARATEDVERNPGAIDSIINSALQSGLSAQGAQLIAGMKQMNEFGSTFKKYTGNGGAATDSLRATIHANQPSTSNSMAVNLNLLGQDEALAQGVQQNLSRPSAHPSGVATPAQPKKAGGFFDKFGGVPLQ